MTLDLRVKIEMFPVHDCLWPVATFRTKLVHIGGDDSTFKAGIVQEFSLRRAIFRWKLINSRLGEICISICNRFQYFRIYLNTCGENGLYTITGSTDKI